MDQGKSSSSKHTYSEVDDSEVDEGSAVLEGASLAEQNSTAPAPAPPPLQTELSVTTLAIASSNCHEIHMPSRGDPSPLNHFCMVVGPMEIHNGVRKYKCKCLLANCGMVFYERKSETAGRYWHLLHRHGLDRRQL